MLKVQECDFYQLGQESSQDVLQVSGGCQLDQGQSSEAHQEWAHGAQGPGVSQASGGQKIPLDNLNQQRPSGKER
jgi:hypothetical protein